MRRPRMTILALALAFVAAYMLGTAPARAVETQMAIDTTIIDFGMVGVDTTSAGMAVVLTNTGGDSFGPINIFGGAPPTPEFGASQNCQGVTLAPGVSCQVTYTFTPSGLSAFDDVSSFTISETANPADGESFVVSLSGVGSSPITGVPLDHDFGGVLVGGTSAPRATTITNVSGSPFGPINIFGGAPPTPEFGASQNCQGATLAPGGSCQISYTFTPSSVGVHNDTSSFTISPTASQADGFAFVVNLTGTGTGPITAEPLSHNFHGVLVGETSPPLSTMIMNVSAAPYGPITMAGGAPGGPFGATQNCQGVTLAPGGSCQVEYTLRPPAAGPYNGVSNFTINGFPFSVTLAGVGVDDIDTVGLVDVSQGVWHLRSGAGVVTSFFYGNPGDLPIAGDWDGDGTATPGLYRQSDGFFYSRNSNTQGPADAECFAGNPEDIPVVGDWDADGDDNLGIYRPSEQRFYLFTTTCVGSPMGAAQIGLLFGNPGDKPVAGDFDGDGVDEVGLHRESTGFFYWRNTLDTGIASGEIFFGDPGDRFISGDFGVVDGVDTPAVYRPANQTFFFRHTLTQGVADSQFTWTGAGTTWHPISGTFGLD